MFYLGIDVSKATLDCCLLYQGVDGKRKNIKTTNTANGFNKIMAWVEKHQCALSQTLVAIEATSIYHESLAMALADAGLQVSVVNPARVRSFAQGLSILHKTDQVDSVVLAKFVALARPEKWTPPSHDARQLNGLLARRETLAADLRREQNRMEKMLSIATPVEIRASIERMTTFIEQEIAQLDQQINDHIDQHPKLKNDQKLLTSIPAIGKRTSLMMLNLLQMHHFDCASQMAAYVGLVPIQRQSGTSLKGQAHLSKAGSAKVRSGLYMAAVVAIQYNPHIKATYQRLLLRGKTKMSALGAAMRKLVHLCFGVIKNQTAYQADYFPKLAI